MKTNRFLRRSLLSSSALIAANMAAAPATAEEGITLDLGGFYRTYYGVGDVDEASNESRDFHHSNVWADGEVHFKGETTLDNGITFGVQIELEAFQSSDQMDENYAYVSGNFGRAIIGGKNTAAYLMTFPAPHVGIPFQSGWITSFIPPSPGHVGSSGFRTPVLQTFIDIGNDNHGLTYFTPRFSGFQLGASWVPSPGTSANGTGDGIQTPGDKDTEITDVLSAAVNYVQDFGSFAIKASAGYTRAEGPENLTPAEDESIEQYMFGVNVGFAGFTFGTSVGIEDSERLLGGSSATVANVGGVPTAVAATPGQSVDGFSYDVGVTYATGRWTFGATYFHSEVEGLTTDGGEDELDAALLGVGYSIGPGISAHANGLWADWDDEVDGEQDGYKAIVGMKLTF